MLCALVCPHMIIWWGRPWFGSAYSSTYPVWCSAGQVGVSYTNV